MAVLGPVAGCGASYQAIYEGEVRFEHCYRLDEEPSVPLPERRECWREWSSFYTYGQTRDRLEYALMRQRALTQLIENPSAVQSASEGEPRRPLGAALAAPGPTSPFEPPPQIHRDLPDSGTPSTSSVEAKASASALVASLTPEKVCALRCASRWQSCRDSCASKDLQRCHGRCNEGFRKCVDDCD